MKNRLYLFVSLLLAVCFMAWSCVETEQEVPVEDIILSQYDAAMTVGDVLILEATIQPANATEKNVSWSSSVASVATVDNNGKVTAVGVGKAVIIAKAGGLLAPCSVVVSPAKIDIVEIKLNKSSLTLTEGDEETLVATIIPGNATVQTVEWKSSDEAVATVTDGLIKAIAPGTAKITASADGHEAVCELTVEKAPDPVPTNPGIYVVGQTAYEFNPKEQQISIYSAEGNSWYRFLFPASLMMYQVGPIPDSAAVGDNVNVVMETFTSGVETAQPVNYSLVIQSKDGVKMTLSSAEGDLFILRY